MPRVLIIKGDGRTAELEFILQGEGDETRVLRDGNAAARHIAENAAPDLAVMDVMLPCQDGFALIERLRASPGWHQVPMLSAKSQEPDVVRALDADGSGHSPRVPPAGVRDIRAGRRDRRPRTTQQRMWPADRAHAGRPHGR